MSSIQSSHEALSDPLPRLYSCFCDKIFTTYPGIYLHLKSKHSNLFQKYKKLKITKLFKKVKDEKGNQLYKLEKLCEKDSSHIYLYQKKSRQNIKKKTRNQILEKMSTKKDEVQLNKNQISANYYHNAYKNVGMYGNYDYPFKNLSQNPKQYIQKINNNQASLYSPHYYNYLYTQGINNYSPFANPFFSQVSASTSQFTTKRLFQQYLSMAAQKKVQQIEQIKNSLYDLMIFIDKNHEVINDPRIKCKPSIFSYCDQFQPRFLGFLMKQYISHLKNRLQEETKEEELRSERESELKHVQKFINWLREMNFIDAIPSIPQPIVIDQNSPSQKQQSIQSVDEKQDQEKNLQKEKQE